jgi:hypothetical protein
MNELRIITHDAAEPEGLVQKCKDCGEVLTDYTNAMGVGKWSPCWWKGLVTVCYGFPKCYSAGQDPDAVRCNAKIQ